MSDKSNDREKRVELWQALGVIGVLGALAFTIHDRVTNLQADLNECEDEVEREEEKVEVGNEARKSLEVQNGALQAEVVNLREQVTDLKTDNKRLQDRIAHLQDKIADMESVAAASFEERRELNQQLAEALEAYRNSQLAEAEARSLAASLQEKGRILERDLDIAIGHFTDAEAARQQEVERREGLEVENGDLVSALVSTDKLLAEEIFRNLQQQALVGECAGRDTFRGFSNCEEAWRGYFAQIKPSVMDCIVERRDTPVYIRNRDAKEVQGARPMDRGAIILCDSALPETDAVADRTNF